MFLFSVKIILVSFAWTLLKANPISKPVSTLSPDTNDTHQNTGVLEREESLGELTEALKGIIKVLNRTYNHNTRGLPYESRYAVRYYRDCQDAYEDGHVKDGIYVVQPCQNRLPFPVYCEMSGEKSGWTVIQRRFNGDISFERNWEEYKEGFGELEGEFWLGLDKIHQLTMCDPDLTNKLYVGLNNGEMTGFSYFDHFKIGNEASKYKLIISGYDPSSPAGDPLTALSGVLFSTTDNDNDFSYKVNCAVKYTGGWWYYGQQCGYSNLNGQYLLGSTSVDKTGVYWEFFGGRRMSLQSSVMKVRA